MIWMDAVLDTFCIPLAGGTTVAGQERSQAAACSCQVALGTVPAWPKKNCRFIYA